MTAPELDLVKWAIEVGSFGLVAWIVTLTFTKTLPTLVEQFRADLKAEREASQKSLDQISDRLERLSIILIYQEARLRGADPKALGSIEELLGQLFGRSYPHNDRRT